MNAIQQISKLIEAGHYQTPPSRPSSAQIAAELGIIPESPNWRAKVNERLGESKIFADHLATVAAWEQTESARLNHLSEAEQAAAKEARNAALRAAGFEHLIGAHFTKSKRGTVAIVRGNTCFPLTAYECELLGRKPGPGND